MNTYNQEAFASMDFPVFFAYRNINTYINIPDISAYFPSHVSDHLVDICVIFKGINGA